MKDNIATKVVRLRLAVGRLGEESSPQWWRSAFFSQQSDAFLSPLFPRSSWASRINSVSQAASRVHDEHVGVGSHMAHLFRLPEALEQQISQQLVNQSYEANLINGLSSSDDATRYLESISQSPTDTSPGPLLLNEVSFPLNAEGVASIATAYFAAFGQGVQVYPYFNGHA